MHDISFLNVEFQASFFTLLFRFHQDALLFFTFCHGVVSSTHLRLLIFDRDCVNLQISLGIILGSVFTLLFTKCENGSSG